MKYNATTSPPCIYPLRRLFNSMGSDLYWKYRTGTDAVCDLYDQALSFWAAPALRKYEIVAKYVYFKNILIVILHGVIPQLQLQLFSTRASLWRTGWWEKDPHHLKIICALYN